jgi:hypothetical protein
MNPRMRTVFIPLSVVVALASIAACSSKSGSDSGFSSSGGGSGSGGGGNGGSGSGGGSGGDTSSGGPHLGSSSGSGGSSGGGGGCNPNAANYDIPGNNCDDDGDGKVDNVTTCDSGLSASGDATAFANSIGICQNADATHWGLVSASYTYGYTKTGAPPPPTIPIFQNNFDQQHGILPTFGSVIKAREGSMLGVLSSGSATPQDSDTPPYFKGPKKGMQDPTNPGDIPQNLPKQAGSCPALSDTVNDLIDVKLKIKVPANAKGLALDFDFWSGEWPDFVCTTYNDAFVAYLNSTALKDKNGTPNGPQNISFDSAGNTISVNNNFFGVCTPGITCTSMPNASTCTLGEGELAGTGFAAEAKERTYPGCSAKSTSGGATSWLTSQAPVTPGETIDLDLLIWDTGDAQYDSSVLVDNFVWVPDPIPGTPVTTPSPPK